MEITVENLERAVSQFYHTDSVLQAEAHRWLTAVQGSPNAWAVVWELLNPHRSGEAQFFAATTLHTKLMKSWSEVPSDQYGFLKNKLLEAVVQYSSGPKIVLNRLCIALSAYLIQTTPHYWENSLADVISMFRPENLPNVQPERVVWILLEVLTVIPEEFQSMTLGQRHKTSVRIELEKAVPQVVSVVEGALACGGEVRTQGVKALVAWLHIGVPLPTCLPLAQTIVASVMEDLSMSGDQETEALSQMGTHPDSHRHPNAVLALLNTILPLSRALESALNDDNKELVSNVYRVFVSIGEYHARLVLAWLVAGEQSADVLVRLLLACTSAPGVYPTDETHSQLTFGFWYILQDEMSSLTKDELSVAKEILVPVYEELTRVLLKKSQYPEEQLNSADAELFRCYRQDIADTLVYCYYVVRGYMVALLGSYLSGARTWQEAEAVIAGAFAVAQSTQDDARLVALLTSVPPHFLANPRVVNTLNQAVGAYSEWLGGQSEVLGRLIPGLVVSLQSTDTATSATMALKDVTRECTLSLRPYARPLLAACQETLSKGQLRHNECVRLMYSVGRLLSILPYDQMLTVLEPLVVDYTNSIEQLLTQEVSAGTKSGLVVRLRMVGTLMGTLYLEEGPPLEPPALLLLRHLLPALARVVQKWSPDLTIVQEICSCLKNAVSSLLEKCESLLCSVLTIIVTCFTSQPNAAALDVARQVVVLFGGSTGDPGNMMTELLRSLAERTVSLVTESGGGEGGVASGSQHCDVLQGFHTLTAGVVKRHPALLARSTDVSRLVAFATMSLLMPEMGTVKSAGSFICNLITQSREETGLLSAVQENGEQLVHTVIRCIGGESPRSGLDTFSEILLCLNKKHCDSLSRWLPAALSQSSLPRASPERRAAFSRAVLRERANKRKLQDLVREFAFICRGLVSTDYSTSAVN